MISYGTIYGNDQGWLEVGEIILSSSLADEDEEDTSNIDVNYFLLEHRCGGGERNNNLQLNSLISLVLQAIPGSSLSKNVSVRIHPLLFFFLKQVADDLGLDDVDEYDDNVGDDTYTISSIAPLPLIQFQAFQSQPPILNTTNDWHIHTINKVEELMDDCHIYISCVYMENDDDNSNDNIRKRIIAISLTERIIMKGCIMLLSTDMYGYIIVKINNIDHPPHFVDEESNTSLTTRRAYKLSCKNNYNFHIDDPPPILQSEDTTTTSADDTTLFSLSRHLHDRDIPGYEELQNEIIDILNVHQSTSAAAAVSGILLTGCSGVGKTRLASCIAHHYNNTNGSRDHTTTAPPYNRHNKRSLLLVRSRFDLSS